MAKSPNGKIVKSLYLKIAYVWTRPFFTILPFGDFAHVVKDSYAL